MTEHRLDGRHVVVTRASAQAAPLVEAIERCGGRTIELPMLEIRDAADGGAALARALHGLSADDWLVVLSPNGSKRVVGRVASGACRLAVVGTATGAVFEKAGWTIDLLPDESSAKGLAKAFLHSVVLGRVLIAQAEHGRPDLADVLRSRGIDVEVVTAYRNQAPTIDDRAVQSAHDADTVVFASPSAVDRYLDAVGLAPTIAVCIGPVTASAARNAGFDVWVAEEATTEALVAAIAGAQPT